MFVRFVLVWVTLFSVSLCAKGDVISDGIEMYPSMFLDFENHGLALEPENPAFYSQAPGIWSACSYIGNDTMGKCSVADDMGVDGHDCLDKTANSSWGNTYGPLRYGSPAPGYDSDIEDKFDNVWSITVCGWFREEPGEPIGGDARLFYREGQFEIYTPSSPHTGRLVVQIPGGGGYNSGLIRKLSNYGYSQPGQWVFFAVTYDGTKTTNNVMFYQATIDSPVQLNSTVTADAGQLTGGEHLPITVGAGGPTIGIDSTAGYLDKFTVYTQQAQSSDAALTIEQLERIRRWHLHLHDTMPEALAGDTDLDGDVDDQDINTITTSIAAGPVQEYYWPDGDVDNDLDVDQDDLDIANANYTGDINDPSVEVAVVSAMTKIHGPSDIPNPGDSSITLYAAKGEHENVQIVVSALNDSVDNIALSTQDLNGTSNRIFSSEQIKISKVGQVRISAENYDPWPDPLLNETTGSVSPGEPLIFWLSVDVPSSIYADTYQGQVIVEVPDRPNITIPITLHIWDFAIPKKQNLQTSYNLFRGILKNVYGGDWNDPTSPAYRQWLDFCLEYRVSPIDMSLVWGTESVDRFVKVTKKTDGSWLFDFSIFDEYVDYILDNGARNFNIGDLGWHFWEPFYGYDEASSQWKYFDDLTESEYEEVFEQYMLQAGAHYASNGPRPYEENAFFYAFDELHPGMPDVLQELTDRHDLIESYWPQLHTLTTGEPLRYPAYEGHLDIWAGKVPNYETYTMPEVDRLRGQGNQFWLYVTGWNSPYCNFEIHEPAIEHRMLFWQNMLYRSEGFLHWGINVWPHYRRPNPWVGQMAAPAAYDRFPNKAWDDAGYVIKTYTKGGGYLIYPGIDGPLSSVRLENMRDGIEDWECLNLLGFESSPGTWTGLIQRAETEGVDSTLINQAKAAADMSSVCQSFTTYTHDPESLEAKRIEIGNAIESLVNALCSQKSPDVNASGSVDILDMWLFARDWLAELLDSSVDLDQSGIVDFYDYQCVSKRYLEADGPVEIIEPQAYFPFENDSGLYGTGSESNPAWANHVPNPDDQPNSIAASSALSWPKISTNGIKGDCLYATDPAWTGLSTMTLNYLDSVTKDIFAGASSYTLTGWVNTRNLSKEGGGRYILHAMGGSNYPALKWNTDGRLQINDAPGWFWTDHVDDFDSNGEWVFFAVTRDSTSIRYYYGSPTSSVSGGKAYTALSLSPLATPGRLTIGGYTYNGNDPYLDFDIDELRIWTATDDSAALNIMQIDEVRKYDLQ